MQLAFDLLFFAASFVAGAVAAVAGFGIGSILTPVLALAIDARIAVAAVAIPHLAGTALRLAMLRVAPDWSVLVSFGAASAAGALVGAILQPALGSRGVTVLLGVLLLFIAVSEWSGLARRLRFEGPAAWAAGAASGLLGGLVGNQGGIRSAALLGFSLKKETFIATATAIALVIDLVRLPIYLGYYSQYLAVRWPLIAAGTFGVLVGTVVGTRFLQEIPEARFRAIVALLIAMLGVSLLL